jgi:hypothetical protein
MKMASIAQMLMNVWKRAHAIQMPPALTVMEALPVSVTLGSMEVVSIVQKHALMGY